MISTLIFSKNRPAQLDICLKSILLNSNNIFNHISILYIYDNNQYKAGYEKCISYYKDTIIKFYLQNNFKNDVIRLLNIEDALFHNFFVDDILWYKKTKLNQNDIQDLFNQGIDTLSLRLGRNTYLEDPYNNKQSVIPRQFFKYNGFYYWDSSVLPEGGDFGYSMSLDGNVYKKDRITNTIIDTEFENPNFLEGRLNHKRREYPYMACQDQSCIVNSPNNRVQSIFNNRSGESFYFDPQIINEQFLDGYRFSLDKIDFSNIIGAHQELQLTMEKCT